MKKESYPNIDMEKTGLLLKYKIQQAGYTVKDIQKKLLLSCPQPIYRWYQGKVLPSVNHLYALSRLLGVHMEELLVPQMAETGRNDKCSIVAVISFAENMPDREQRILAYSRKLAVA